MMQAFLAINGALFTWWDLLARFWPDLAKFISLPSCLADLVPLAHVQLQAASFGRFLVLTSNQQEKDFFFFHIWVAFGMYRPNAE